MDNPFFTPPPIIPSHPPTPVKTTLPEDPFKNPPFINNNAIKNPLPEINTVPKILEEDPFFSPPRIVSAPAVEDPFFHLPKAISLEVPIEIDPLFHPPKIIAPDTHNLIPPKHLSYGAVQTKNDDGELEEGEISGPTHKKPVCTRLFFFSFFLQLLIFLLFPPPFFFFVLFTSIFNQFLNIVF